MPTDVEAARLAARLGLNAAFAEEPTVARPASSSEAAAGAANYPAGWTSMEPYPVEWADLLRLYALVRLRRVTKILEFGCGYSTAIMAHGLAVNDGEFGDDARAGLRRSDPFRLHAVDDVPAFVEIARGRLTPSTSGRVEFHCAPVRMTTFGDRICTAYDSLPNVCPDLVYLDGPDQHQVEGDVAGISTRHPDRLPMACDILRIEHFLLPGTLVVVDGRTANARFLKANLQREWRHEHDEEGDVHYFEMIEDPLGKWNRRQIEFCLGPDWRSRPLRPDYSRLLS